MDGSKGNEVVTQYCLISRLCRSNENRKVFWLKEGRNVVGRGKKADVKLLTTVASREHCAILVNGTYITITDLGSLNGTFVEKKPLPPHMERNILPEDVLGFGLTDDEPNCDFPVVYQLTNRRKRPTVADDDAVSRKKRLIEVVELSSDDSSDVCIVENIRQAEIPDSPPISDGDSCAKKGRALSNREVEKAKPSAPYVQLNGVKPEASSSVLSCSVKDPIGCRMANGESSNLVPVMLPDASNLAPVMLPDAPLILNKSQLSSESTGVTCGGTWTPKKPNSPGPSVSKTAEDSDDDILLMSQLFETNPPPTPKALLKSKDLPRDEETIILDSPEYDDANDESVEDAVSLTQCLLDLDPANVNSPKRLLPREAIKDGSSLSKDKLFEILSARSEDSPKPSTSGQARPVKALAGFADVVENLKKRQKEGGRPKQTKQISPKEMKPRRSLKSAKMADKPCRPASVGKSVPIVPNTSSSRKVISKTAPASFKRPNGRVNQQVPMSIASLTSTCCLVKDICQWPVKDFLNDKTTGEETNVSKAVTSIPSTFASVDAYADAYKSLLSQELWAEVIRDAREQETDKEIPMYDGIADSLSDVTSLRMFPPDLNQVTCTSKCFSNKKTLNDQNAPKYGNLGLIMLKTSNDAILYPSFAVVTNNPTVTDRPNKSPSFGPLNASLPSGHSRALNAGCFLELTFSVKKDKLQECISRKLPVFFTYRNLKNIQKHWRIFSILDQIKYSPLCEIILDPERFTPKPKIDAKVKPYSGFPMNAMQREAVLSVNETVWKSKKSVSLIHGPPGTGKTSVICSLVLELLHQGRTATGFSKKILLCSPSNAAIDEIVGKLIQIRTGLKPGSKFKLTRVGMTENCESAVKHVTSNNLAMKEVKRILESPELTSGKIEFLRNKERSLRAPQRISRDSRARLKCVEDCLKSLEGHREKKICELSREFKKLVDEEEIELISGADIVTTTLASSSIKKMTIAFGRVPAFCCAIVDESTQAIEPETLQPLYHSINHLVLVGDPLQLPPTTLSKIVRESEKSWSLFDRLYTSWVSKPSAPLYRLVEQYRMHPDIVSFPSRQFYSDLLVNRFNKPASILRPYALLHHNFKEDDDGEKNQGEADFVIKLTKLYLKRPDLSKYSLGIIVPYRRQCRYVEDKVRKLPKENTLKPVFVNTIDSYQGQERDIILFCCVRSERTGFLSDSHRINVALTRARQSLVILGNFEALNRDHIWNNLYTDALRRQVIVRVGKQPENVFEQLFLEQSSQR